LGALTGFRHSLFLLPFRTIKKSSYKGSIPGAF